jgi:hypothetical protein
MSDDFWTVNRIASGICAAATITAGAFIDGYRGASMAFAVCILPIACIWIGEPLNFARDSRLFGRRIASPIAGGAPGFVYTLIGWMMLFAFTAPFWFRLVSGLFR